MQIFLLSGILVILTTHTASHRVTESIEDVPPEAFFNTTTLYPVANKIRIDSEANETAIKNEKQKISSDETAWKVETASTESSNIPNDVNTTETSKVNKTDTYKEFKPSPHLGSLLEVEANPTRPTFHNIRPLKIPPKGFISSSNDQFEASLFNKDERHLNDFPYKFESGFHTRAKNSWRPSDLQSKPTMEAPVRVPAGGLYKSPEAFKEKPAWSDDEYGLDLNDLKENGLDEKKRVNPWRNLLHLMTAFIPVGLIISALTPNVITVHNIGPDPSYPKNPFRKSEDVADLSPISESCRRRLLCELHSDKNYSKLVSGSPRRRRRCHKLSCEDPQTLSRMLQWLLTRHNTTENNKELHFR